MLGFGSGRFRRRALFAPTFRWLFDGLLRPARLQRCPDPARRHGAAGELANRLNSGNAYRILVLADPVREVVPEPGTWLVLGTGLGGIALAANRRASLGRRE